MVFFKVCFVCLLTSICLTQNTLTYFSQQNLVAVGAFLAATVTIDCLVSATTSSRSTFSSPAAKVRPKFRYWLVFAIAIKSHYLQQNRLPDGSVDPSLVAADIESIGALGAGGIEFNNDFDVRTCGPQLQNLK